MVVFHTGSVVIQSLRNQLQIPGNHKKKLSEHNMSTKTLFMFGGHKYFTETIRGPTEFNALVKIVSQVYM